MPLEMQLLQVGWDAVLQDSVPVPHSLAETLSF